MSLTTLTQKDLREQYGWSSYLIRTLCRGLEFTPATGGLKLYIVQNLLTTIDQKLAQPRTQPKTREILIQIRNNLAGQSNVIEVNFLQKLPADQKLAILMERREKLRAQGEQLLQSIDQTLAEARQLV